MSSVVQICNRALGRCGAENRVLSVFPPDPDLEEAILCNQNYEALRDAVLEEGEWTFATEYFQLIPDATTPAWGWGQRFLLPANVLRAVRVKRTDDRHSPDIEWARSGNYIFSDEKLIYVTAVVREEDPAKFSATFEDALAQRLAAELALPLAHSRSLYESLLTVYQGKMEAAMATEGKQGTRQNTRADRLVTVRRAGFASYPVGT